VPGLHANGRVSTGNLLVLARLGGIGRRGCGKNEGKTDDGSHKLDR
jgi:hypothetical protein